MSLTTRGKLVVAVGILLGLVGVAALGGYMYLRSIGTFGTNEPGRPIEIVIPEGASAIEIGRLLESKGVIESTLAWRVALFLEGGGEAIEAGKYNLFVDLTAPDALALLSKGATVDFVTVTFPEGSWVADFARIVGKSTHISAAEFTAALDSGEVTSKLKPDDVDTFEGLLFPSTYQVIEKDTAVTLAQRIVDEFERQVARIDFSGVAADVSVYEAIIVASMVEAEAKVDNERPKVASVIYNRLAVGEKLGIDATVLYALGEHKDTLTVSELAIDSPYNTRLYAGLPPTPIGAPGSESLEAAAEPAPGELFFYVVADCQGHHAFSETAAEFARDKAAYLALDCG
ncbi:MAG: endolytic transglycosylase MltG [Actinomycetota bacterium]|nr:endolytic transglycosylase MltG [Actinomycetota bacterium]